jgi:hypothetical protein
MKAATLFRIDENLKVWAINLENGRETQLSYFDIKLFLPTDEGKYDQLILKRSRKLPEIKG